jgi:predicted nucleic acid-binding protein
VKPAVILDVVRDDPDDNRILECAVAAGSDYLVSGDQDLLRLKRYAAIRMLSVPDFLVMEREGRRI